MAPSEVLLNLVVPPLATVALLISLPTITVVKTLKWFWAWLTPENVRSKVVLITGASSGIGEHIAYEYAKKGAQLVLVARREEQLQAVASSALRQGAADVHVVVGDVSSEDDCKMVVDATIQKYGHLDHLVNDAGNVNSFFFRECDTKSLHTTVDTDFWGPINMTYFALPHLRQSHGKIMVIASIGSWLPHPREAIYNGAKAGILQFFDTLRNEERDSLASITIVMPGMTESEATGGKLVGEKGEMIMDTERRDAHFGLQPMAYAATVAKAAVHSTLRGYRYVITPYFYTALLLWRNLAPEMIDMMFYSQAVKNPAKPINKQILEATGAQKYAYTESTRKEK